MARRRRTFTFVSFQNWEMTIGSRSQNAPQKRYANLIDVAELLSSPCADIATQYRELRLEGITSTHYR